jgi:hypothetical protein
MTHDAGFSALCFKVQVHRLPHLRLYLVFSRVSHEQGLELRVANYETLFER